MATLIREHIMRLHLDPHAKYPHELLRDEAKMAEAKAEILRCRRLTYGPRLAVVGRDGDIRGRDSDDLGPDPVDGGEVA